MALWRSTSLVAAALSAATMSHPVATGFDAVPRAYNPGDVPVHITALWSSEAAVPSHRALTLAMSQMVAFPPGASATAVVTGTEGLTLTHLGFDHKLATHCTNGSPRWDVETSDGSSYAFGCAAGIHDIDLPAVGWERVTFSCSDVQVLKGLPGSCPLGTGQMVKLLQIVQDEAASTTLDNLEVNWTVIQSPASQQQ